MFLRGYYRELTTFAISAGLCGDSMLCPHAGDLCKDRQRLASTLVEHIFAAVLSKGVHGVFFMMKTIHFLLKTGGALSSLGAQTMAEGVSPNDAAVPIFCE
jgi:hypothetical protein